MSDQNVKISKFLSLVLRHQPEKIGLTPDAAGWVPVAELLTACQNNSVLLTLEQLRAIVRGNDKQRFSFGPDERLIRANQGHSIEVDLGYTESLPPAPLFHGTAELFLASIMAQGLVKGRRHHVHLSSDIKTALAVGRRYGRPVVLEVASLKMCEDGHKYYLSENGVWLTNHIPVEYLRRMDTSAESAI